MISLLVEDLLVVEPRPNHENEIVRVRHAEGDLGDPDSKVSQLVADRNGVAPLPELGYAPTNRYLPPRPRRNGDERADEATPSDDAGSLATRWLNRILKR